MNERDIWWKIVLVAVLSALALAAVLPIQEKIKWGIDLAGGYSLMYELDNTGMEGTDRTELPRRVIEVLQRRVDPRGVFNLVWRPVGTNRIEIQMPAPPANESGPRQVLEEHQDALRKTILRRNQVVAAISRTAEDRPVAFQNLAMGIDRRVDLLNAAANAYDALKSTQVEYEARKSESTTKNITRTQIDDWVKLPAEERTAQLDTLVLDVPTRKGLLEAAARAWDAFDVAKKAEEAAAAAESPTTDLAAETRALRSSYETAVGRALGTNIDVDSGTAGVTINTVVEQEEKLDAAIADVLRTNVDVNRLQVLLEMAPTPGRQDALDEIIKAHPSQKETLEAIVEASDRLNTKTRGEGRLDPADLQRLLRGAGVLEFRILPRRSAENNYDDHRKSLQERGPRASVGDEYAWFEIEDVTDFTKRSLDDLARNFDAIKANSISVLERFGDKYYVLASVADHSTMTHGKTDAKDWSLKSARFTRDESGRPAVGFTLDEVGGSKFSRLTRDYRGEQLGIFLDDRAVSAPNINSPIRTQGIIQGDFTPDEVNEMVKKLNAGSLPQKLKEPPISVRSIGPSLGAANRSAGLNAAKWGGIIVAIFMLIYYFYAGGIAVIAVAINILLIGAMMATLGATMTLPGIAGLVLAIGMAVDANVLINERIREETAKGTALRMAIKLGYERAFRAILDSNITTVLTCVILYMVGSEQVKGFGLTLGVGVFINIFTAYFVTRLFFEFMSIISVPKEVVRYPFYAAVTIAAAGAAFLGLAHLLNSDAESLKDSVARGFGLALLIEVAPAVIIAMGLMFLFRSLHHGKKELPMMKFIGVPKVDWVSKRKFFMGLSAVLITVGLFGAFSLKADQIMDIEFLGGTSAQIQLVENNSFDQSKDLPTQISERLEVSATHLAEFSDKMKNADVSESDGVITIKSGVPAIRLEPVIYDELGDELSEAEQFRFADAGAGEVKLFVRNESKLTADEAKSRLAKRLFKSSESMKGAQVQTNAAFDAGGEAGKSFTIVTRETAKEIVVSAILDQMEGDINVKPALSFSIVDSADSNEPYFPIAQTDPRALGLELSDEAAASIDLTRWQGGVAIALDNLSPPQSIDDLRNRLKAMRLQPGFEKFGWRESDVFGLERAAVTTAGAADAFSKVMVVVADDNISLHDSDDADAIAVWKSSLAEPEVTLIQEALQRQQSLEQVTQFDNQVSGESQIQAGLALALSWLLIIVFVWIRFGNVRWGFAAVMALIHDVLIAISAVAVTYYIAQYLPAIGNILMIDKVFRIDLAMVAALLTVVGYSVNDTIIVFDRIRENRGRQTDVTVDMVNSSINQTLSRTVLTLLTSLITVFIMYAFGGEGIHSFNYVLFVGLVVGTYSSIGIASQFLLSRMQLKAA